MLLSKVRSTARSFSFPSWSVPIALLFLVLLGYGLRALSLGFYWDDWPYLWYFHRLGPAGIVDAFEQDRPFLSFIYTTTLSLFGNSTVAWQAFGLFARWLCSLGLWWVLAAAWPAQAHKSAWAVFLFTLYPGFTQQWIAVIYGQAFFLYAFVFFSIAITLVTARRWAILPRWVIFLAAAAGLGLSAFTMFSTEYFFGLELLRPILLWLVLAPGQVERVGNNPRAWLRRAGKVLAWWLPYLLLMIVFIIWRGFIQIFPAASLTALQDLSQSPLHEILNLTLTILEDLVESSLAAWGQTLQLAGFLDAGWGAGLKLLGVILVTGAASAAYLAWLRPQQVPEGEDRMPHNHWARQVMLVGALAFLSAGWPFWITGLPMRLGFPQDRYSLPLAPGICLFLAGLVDFLGRQAGGRAGMARKAAVIGLALGLAAGYHANLALKYRQDWNAMRDFFWQLAWRAPSVEPGTLFLTSDLPFAYYEDDSLSSPLNWTLDASGDSKEMPYILYDLKVRKQALPSLQADRPVKKDFRATTFSGTTSQTLVLSYSLPGCVRVLDPVYDSQLYQLPDRLQDALLLSNPARWITDQSPGASPPEEIFGSEPKHRWCYFYEKADLARQMGDWEAILEIENNSIHEGLRPEDPAEYLPFIEAYTRLGLFDDAVQLTLSTYFESRDLSPALCSVWSRAVQSGIEPRQDQLDKVEKNLNCSLP